MTSPILAPLTTEYDSGTKLSIKVGPVDGRADTYSLVAEINFSNGCSCSFVSNPYPSQDRILMQSLSRAIVNTIKTSHADAYHCISELRNLSQSGSGTLEVSEPAVEVVQLTRPELQTIINHPFEYGFEGLLREGRAVIFNDPNSSNGNLIGLIPLPRVSDTVWRGNCATNSLLVMAALEKIPEGAGAKIQTLAYSFPERGIHNLHHQRVVIPELGNLTIEHGSFFKSLNPENARCGWLLKQEKDFAPPMELDFSRGVYLKEVTLGSDQYVFQGEIDNQFIISVAARQQRGGIITGSFAVQIRVADLLNIYSQSISIRPIAERFGQLLSLSQVDDLTTPSKPKLVDWPHPALHTCFRDSFLAIAQGIFSGRDTNACLSILAPNHAQMTMFPTSWWKS